MTRPLLEVEDLAVEFDTHGGTVKAVRGVNFTLSRGKTLAIVGESGCGKSVCVQSLMGLIPMPPGRITGGSARLDGEEILGRTRLADGQICGQMIGMIFQDPMNSLNPTMRIGDQIAEPLRLHRGMSRPAAARRAVELLELSQVAEPERRARQYPFEFSGGMLQRVMIACALACEPRILVADEPTTALDVTIQAQILNLMRDLQHSQDMSLLLITHDLGVVAHMADEVAVMYAGQVVEAGSVDDIFYRSGHPYTQGLKSAMPRNEDRRAQQLDPIAGSPPDLFDPPQGCAYFERCPHALNVCEAHAPAMRSLSGSEHKCACWLQDARAPGAREGVSDGDG